MYKKIGVWLLTVVSLATMVAGLVPPPKASAVGEAYAWKDGNTILVSGGDLEGGPHEFKLVQGSNPERFANRTGIKHKAGCYIGFFINITGANSATLASSLPRADAPPSVGNPGQRSCSQWDYQNNRPAFPGVSESFNNKTINITGTRGNNQTESEADKEVSVYVNSPNPNSTSPNNITIQIKDATGKVIRTATPNKEPALGSDDPNSDTYVDPAFQPVNYGATFKLEPGDYTVCASIVIEDCRKFKKEKFKSLILEYGEKSTEKQLKVTVEVGYLGGPKDLTVGPLEVTIRRPDGSEFTQATDTKTHKMTPEEEASQGGGIVEYDLFLYTTFNNLEPGRYFVCVEGVQDCKEVIKKSGENAEVKFTLDWNAFNPNNEEEKDCKDKYEAMGVKAITFLVCSIIDTATYTVGQLEHVITNMLKVNTDDIFNDTDASNAFHIAWNSFRYFALGLIVIATLIMVVSQAAGLEVFDAYTVKKVLPRLLFAAIFIALSWDILEFLFILSNDAGQGIRSLIYAPFRELDYGGDIGGGSIFAVSLITTGAALAFGFMGLLSFVLTGLIAALVAVTVLIFRKMLILLVVMMSPFAIAAYVLPNTQKLWTIWKTTLVAVLVVFPIIMAFIAMGRVFALVAFHSPGSATINQLIAVIAYFAPYFMLSLAFRMAGGFVATVGGVVNNRAKGALDGLKNYRGRNVSQNMADMAAGQRFQGNNPLARGFNSATFGATTFAQAKNKGTYLNPVNYLSSRGRGKLALTWQKNAEQQRALNAMRYGKSDQAQVAKHNDPLLRAQTYISESAARANMSTDWNMSEEDVSKAIAAAKSNGGFGRNQQLNAANQLFATGTGYDNLRQVHDTVQRVAGENEEMAMAILGNGNATTKGVGRHDLAAGFGTHRQLYLDYQANGSLSDDQINAAYIDAIKGNDATSILRNKTPSINNLMPALNQALHEARTQSQDMSRSATERSAAAEEAGRLAGIAEMFQNNTMYAAPINIQQTDRHVLTPSGSVRLGGSGVRDEIREEASLTEGVAIDPTTGRTIADPATGRPLQLPNMGHNPDVARGYNQQRPRRPGDE